MSIDGIVVVEVAVVGQSTSSTGRPFPSSFAFDYDVDTNGVDVVRGRGERPPPSSYAFDYDANASGVDVLEMERRPPPLTTPKSHVAYDDMGMNNIDFRVNTRPPRHDNHHRHHYHHHHDQQQQQHQQLHQQLLQERTLAAAAFSAAYSAGGSLKNFLRRGGGGVSSGGGTNSTITSYADDEVNTEHSIDMVVIVPPRNAGRRRPLPTPTAVVPASSDAVDNVDVAHWSSLSVKAAMAVMSAGGGDVIARRAANAVLDFGDDATRKREGGDVDGCLHDLAAKVSLAILEAGGDHGVATAASVAIMNERGKRKNEEGAKNATPCQNGNGGENGDVCEPLSVGGTMEVNSTRPGKTNKMADKGNKEDGKARARANQNMEEDIDRKRKELGIRQARSGATTSSRATESSKIEEIKKVGLATQDKQQQQQQQQQQGQIDAKEEALREKEAQIALKSQQLEEVSRLNLEKERQIRERMAALDAATAAIIERVEVVQRKIDHRANVNVADQNGRSGGIERVDMIHEAHDKGICVSTSSHVDPNAPLPHVNVHPRRQEPRAQNDEKDSSLFPHQRQQTPTPLQQNTVFKQLTDKVFSIMDVACNDSYYSPPNNTNTNTTMDGGNSHVTGTLFSLMNKDPNEYKTEPQSVCDTLEGTLSGLTDEQRWSHWANTRLPQIQESHAQSGANQTSNQASNRPIQKVMSNRQLNATQKVSSPNYRPNQNTNQRNGEQSSILRTNRVTSPRGQSQARYQGQVGKVGKENRSKSLKRQSTPPPVTSGLTKLKSGLLTRFGRKAATKGSPSPHERESDSRGQLFMFSSGKSDMFEL
ncbi:hypothetical protein ACHAW5_004839 [Stephanodiscus triporus]|uniref:Uncharacterized protein n=1 Tax=Stephanodiscus triporus TaxID=2934178 RepID=A0ABD3MNA7_9STRA